MKNQDYIDELLGKYFAHEHLTSEQQHTLEDWIKNNPEDFERIRTLMDFTDHKLHENHTFDVQRAWDKISPQLSERRHRNTRIWTFISAIAASIVLVWIGTRFFFNQNDPDKTIYLANRTNKIEKHLLPDSSEIILFPKSEVKCIVAQTQHDRKVKLKGKAFFEVKKANGRKFIVNTDNIKVEVMGTSFIVDASTSKTTTVQVRTGLVRVSDKEISVDLKQNEQVKISGRTIQKERITDAESTFGFANKILVLKEEQIENVIQQITEVTGIEIEIDDKIRHNAITARLDLNKPEEIINEIAFLCQCHYQQIDSSHYRLYYEDNP